MTLQKKTKDGEALKMAVLVKMCPACGEGQQNRRRYNQQLGSVFLIEYDGYEDWLKGE